MSLNLLTLNFELCITLNHDEKSVCVETGQRTAEPPSETCLRVWAAARDQLGLRLAGQQVGGAGGGGQAGRRAARVRPGRRRGHGGVLLSAADRHLRRLAGRPTRLQPHLNTNNTLTLFFSG